MNRRSALRALAAASAAPVCPLRAQGARKRIHRLSTDPAPGRRGPSAFRMGRVVPSGILAPADEVIA